METDATCSWWDSWADYTGFHLADGDTPTVRERDESEASPARPPAIDNEPLQKLGGFDKTELKSDLQEGKDYKLVCGSTWKLLHSWYGGEPAFYRQWVEGPQPYVEVYALQLNIKRHSNQSQAVLFISRQVAITTSKQCLLSDPPSLHLATVPQSGDQGTQGCHHTQAKKSELKSKACQLMGLEEESVKMWDYYLDDLYANMEEQLDEPVGGLGNALQDKQAVLLEEKVCQAHFQRHDHTLHVAKHAHTGRQPTHERINFFGIPAPLCTAK